MIEMCIKCWMLAINVLLFFTGGKGDRFVYQYGTRCHLPKCSGFIIYSKIYCNSFSTAESIRLVCLKKIGIK